MLFYYGGQICVCVSVFISCFWKDTLLRKIICLFDKASLIPRTTLYKSNLNCSLYTLRNFNTKKVFCIGTEGKIVLLYRIVLNVRRVFLMCTFLSPYDVYVHLLTVGFHRCLNIKTKNKNNLK